MCVFGICRVCHTLNKYGVYVDKMADIKIGFGSLLRHISAFSTYFIFGIAFVDCNVVERRVRHANLKIGKNK